MNYRDQRYSIILFSWVVEGNHYLALAPSQRNIIIMYYSVINMYHHRKDLTCIQCVVSLSFVPNTHSPRYNLFNIYPTFLQVTHIDIRSVDVIRVRNSIFRFQNYSVMVICNNEKNHLTISWKLFAVESYRSGIEKVVGLQGTMRGFWFFSIFPFLAAARVGWTSVSLMALLNSSLRSTGYLRRWTQCFWKSPIETGLA